MGPYKVSSYKTSFSNGHGDYRGFVYYPNTQGYVQGYPLVVFSHGFMAWQHLYDTLARDIASHGYTVLTFTVPTLTQNDPRQWQDGYASGLQHMRVSPLMDDTMPTFIGHSMGGNGAMLAAANREDTAFIGIAVGYPREINSDMAFSLAKASSFLYGPSFLMVGSNDGLPGAEASSRHFIQIPEETQKDLCVIRGGNHVQYMDEGFVSKVAGLFDSRADISHKTQLRQAGDKLAAWLKAIHS